MNSTKVHLLNELNLAIKKLRIAERIFRQYAAQYVNIEIEEGPFTNMGGLKRKLAVDAHFEVKARKEAVRKAKKAFEEF